MIFVKDLERMTAFDRDALQLRELPELAQDGWVEFDAGGARLALHEIPAQYANSIVIETPPRAREVAATKLVFEVAELAPTMALAAARCGDARAMGVPRLRRPRSRS